MEFIKSSHLSIACSISFSSELYLKSWMASFCRDDVVLRLALLFDFADELLDVLDWVVNETYGVGSATRACDAAAEWSWPPRITSASRSELFIRISREAGIL